jgi:hypothetical protein
MWLRQKRNTELQQKRTYYRTDMINLYRNEWIVQTTKEVRTSLIEAVCYISLSKLGYKVKENAITARRYGQLMRYVVTYTLQKPCTSVWGEENYHILTHLLTVILDYLIPFRNYTGYVPFEWWDYKRWTVKAVERGGKAYFKLLLTILFERLGKPMKYLTG